MLLPERSNWQARVHNKFEEFAQGLDGKLERRDAEIQVRQTAFPRAIGVGEGSAAKLSNNNCAIFMQLRHVARPRRMLDEIHPFRKCSLTSQMVSECPQAAPDRRSDNALTDKTNPRGWSQ
jgi:hypothetical protein